MKKKRAVDPIEAIEPKIPTLLTPLDLEVQMYKEGCIYDM